MKYFFEIIKRLRYHRLYVYYSLAYGLSTLIVPLGVQFLVNNLALSGLWLNITGFILVIVVGLVISQVIKHSQLVINESLQREIFCIEIDRWRNFNVKEYSHYYFEVMNLMKSFSKSYSNLIELALFMVFGLTTIVLFHPAFLPIPILIVVTLYQIHRSSLSALTSSLKESNEKYHLYDVIHSDGEVQVSDQRDFLLAREGHFKFVRRNSVKVSALIVVVQTLLLAIGCYLIKANQLSVGQLVSAEIIISGIFIPLAKLPLTLESVYDYETSKLKIRKVIGRQNA